MTQSTQTCFHREIACRIKYVWFISQDCIFLFVYFSCWRAKMNIVQGQRWVVFLSDPFVLLRKKSTESWSKYLWDIAHTVLIGYEEIGYEEIFHNFSRQHTGTFLQENNLYNVFLSCLDHHCTWQLPLQSPQTTLHKKIINSFVRILTKLYMETAGAVLV